jgi:hypothetical protein
MSESSTQGPEPVPPQAWYFVLTLIGILAALIAGWIIKEL